MFLTDGRYSIPRDDGVYFDESDEYGSRKFVTHVASARLCDARVGHIEGWMLTSTRRCNLDLSFFFSQMLYIGTLQVHSKSHMPASYLAIT